MAYSERALLSPHPTHHTWPRPVRAGHSWEPGWQGPSRCGLKAVVEGRRLRGLRD